MTDVSTHPIDLGGPGEDPRPRADVELVRSVALSSAELWHEILQRLTEVQQSQIILARSIEELGTIVRDAVTIQAPGLASARSAAMVIPPPPAPVSERSVDVAGTDEMTAGVTSGQPVGPEQTDTSASDPAASEPSWTDPTTPEAAASEPSWTDEETSAEPSVADDAGAEPTAERWLPFGLGATASLPLTPPPVPPSALGASDPPDPSSILRSRVKKAVEDAPANGQRSPDSRPLGFHVAAADVLGPLEDDEPTRATVIGPAEAREAMDLLLGQAEITTFDQAPIGSAEASQPDHAPMESTELGQPDHAWTGPSGGPASGHATWDSPPDVPEPVFFVRPLVEQAGELAASGTPPQPAGYATTETPLSAAGLAFDNNLLPPPPAGYAFDDTPLASTEFAADQDLLPPPPAGYTFDDTPLPPPPAQLIPADTPLSTMELAVDDTPLPSPPAGYAPGPTTPLPAPPAGFTPEMVGEILAAEVVEDEAPADPAAPITEDMTITARGHRRRLRLH